MFEHKIFKMDFSRKRTFCWNRENSRAAAGSAILRYGETMVMVNVSKSAKPRDGIDFFPFKCRLRRKIYIQLVKYQADF